MANKTKTCSTCGKTKYLSDFYNDKKAKDGKQYNCKTCSNLRLKQYQSRKAELAVIKGDVKNAVCTQCSVSKPIDQFRKRREDYGGGYYAFCKECSNRSNKNKGIPMPEKPEIDFTKPLDNLDFLKDLGGWTDQEIKEFLMTVDTYRKAPHFMKLKNICLRFFPNRGVLNCSWILKEFKEAALHNMTFSEYMKTGRKFRRDGQKVLIPSRKK